MATTSIQTTCAWRLAKSSEGSSWPRALDLSIDGSHARRCIITVSVVGGCSYCRELVLFDFVVTVNSVVRCLILLSLLLSWLLLAWLFLFLLLFTGLSDCLTLF